MSRDTVAELDRKYTWPKSPLDRARVEKERKIVMKPRASGTALYIAAAEGAASAPQLPSSFMTAASTELYCTYVDTNVYIHHYFRLLNG